MQLLGGISADQRDHIIQIAKAYPSIAEQTLRQEMRCPVENGFPLSATHLRLENMRRHFIW
jgi:hypothetical protein